MSGAALAARSRHIWIRSVKVCPSIDSAYLFVMGGEEFSDGRRMYVLLLTLAIVKIRWMTRSNEDIRRWVDEEADTGRGKR